LAFLRSDSAASGVGFAAQPGRPVEGIEQAAIELGFANELVVPRLTLDPFTQLRGEFVGRCLEVIGQSVVVQQHGDHYPARHPIR
jgi:hypothetical protein